MILQIIKYKLATIQNVLTENKYACKNIFITCHYE